MENCLSPGSGWVERKKNLLRGISNHKPELNLKQFQIGSVPDAWQKEIQLLSGRNHLQPRAQCLTTGKVPWKRSSW